LAWVSVDSHGSTADHGCRKMQKKNLHQKELKAQRDLLELFPELFTLSIQ